MGQDEDNNDLIRLRIYDVELVRLPLTESAMLSQRAIHG